MGAILQRTGRESNVAFRFSPFTILHDVSAYTGQRPDRKVLAFGLLGLCFFLAWQALVVGHYVRTDTRPPSWDQAVHLEIALDYRQAMAQGRWGDIMNLAPKPGMPPFPPLYHLALAKFYDPARPAAAALWLNWFYLAILAVSLFGITYYFRPDHTALLAAMAFCCAPAVQELLTTQLIDLAVVACSAAAFWALLLSEEFQSWPWSLAFGALYAVGMMHKWSFFSYMIPAYFLWFKALGNKRSRLQALAAAAVALAGFLPWYAIHAAALVPRLVQASSDAAVPVWEGGAFFSYFVQSGTGLGPLLWALGWVGLVAAHYRRNGERSWLLAVWIAGSYLFWALVPNRQLRFLLPGLPGLAVAFACAWPDALTWVVAGVQVVTAANFIGGWISPIPLNLPGATITLLPSDPPRTEDWKVDDILKEAEARADPGSDFANLTLVANAPRFNGPTFTYEAKRLGLKKVHLRGVNKRLCEFSRFVVLKEGDLGPPEVIGGLPEAAEVINDKKSWFPKAYEAVGRWPLPDGTAATLYEQRRFIAAPLAGRSVQYQFYDNDSLKADDLRVSLGAWDKTAGEYPQAVVSAGEVMLRGLRVEHPSLELDGVSLVPASKPPASEWDDVRLLKMRRLRVRSMAIEGSDLKDFLEQRVRGLKIQSLVIDGTIKLDALYGSLAVSAELRPQLQANPPALVLRLVDAKAGTTSLPAAVTGPFQAITIPFTPNPETPFAIDLAGLTLAGNRLTVP